MFAPRAGIRGTLPMVVVVSAMLLPGCVFSVPVGDPETSKADPALVGYWVEDADKLVTVYTVALSKDGQYYDFTAIGCDGTLQKPTEYLDTDSGIAWLTDVADAQFLTCKFSDNPSLPKRTRDRIKKKPYTIDKLEITKEGLRLTSLDPDFPAFRDAKTRTAMEAAVTKHLKNPKAFVSKPSEFKRATAADVKEVLKLAAAGKKADDKKTEDRKTDDKNTDEQPAKAATKIEPLQGADPPWKDMPREFVGQALKPRGRAAADAVDWNVLHFDEGSVTAVKLYGFDPYNGGKPLNVEIKDAATLKTIEWVASGGVVRTATSDVGRGGSATGGGAYLGVLKVQTAKRDLVIAVSHVGFFLGVYYGSSRQTFFSWGLAKQVDELVFNATGKHLEKADFEALSGEWIINVSKQQFEKARGRKEPQRS